MQIPVTFQQFYTYFHQNRTVNSKMLAVYLLKNVVRFRGVNEPSVLLDIQFWTMDDATAQVLACTVAFALYDLHIQQSTCFTSATGAPGKLGNG